MADTCLAPRSLPPPPPLVTRYLGTMINTFHVNDRLARQATLRRSSGYEMAVSCPFRSDSGTLLVVPLGTPWSRLKHRTDPGAAPSSECSWAILTRGILYTGATSQLLVTRSQRFLGSCVVSTVTTFHNYSGAMLYKLPFKANHLAHLIPRRLSSNVFSVASYNPSTFELVIPRSWTPRW